MNNPWDGIGTPPATQLKARRVSPDHPLNFYWAKDHNGKYLFIYVLPEAFQADNRMLPDFSGMDASFVPSRLPSAALNLVLSLKESESWGIFHRVCTDLLSITEGLEDTAYAVQVVMRQLARWHDFLKIPKSALLSEERVKGLIGELRFLGKHLLHAFDANQAISYWQGPLGAPQDFSMPDCYVEVKCRADPNSPYVRISSVDQLCPDALEMYLLVINLAKASEDGKSVITLPQLIAEIRGDLRQTMFAHASLDAFEDLLFQAGYFYSEQYEEYKYVVESELIFRVDENFPRLCRENIPGGVTNLAYSIELSACQPFRATPAWIEASQ